MVNTANLSCFPEHISNKCVLSHQDRPQSELLGWDCELRCPGAGEDWIQCDISASVQGAAGERWCSDEVGDGLSSQHPAGW